METISKLCVLIFYTCDLLSSSVNKHCISHTLTFPSNDDYNSDGNDKDEQQNSYHYDDNSLVVTTRFTLLGYFSIV